MQTLSDLDIRIYQKGMQGGKNGNNESGSVLPAEIGVHLRYHRPHLGHLLEDLSQVRPGEKMVASCGPAGMTSIIRRQVSRLSSSDNQLNLYTRRRSDGRKTF